MVIFCRFLQISRRPSWKHFEKNSFFWSKKQFFYIKKRVFSKFISKGAAESLQRAVNFPVKAVKYLNMKNMNFVFFALKFIVNSKIISKFANYFNYNQVL